MIIKARVTMVAVLLWVATIANAQTSSFPLGTLVYMDTYPHAMLAFSDSARVIECAQNTWAHITNPGCNLFDIDEARHVTVSCDSLVVQYAGDYFVALHIAFEGNNGELWQFGMFKNGVLSGYTTRRYTSNNDVGQITVLAYMNDAEVGDSMKPMIRNLTDDDDPTIISGQLYIKWEFD